MYRLKIPIIFTILCLNILFINHYAFANGGPTNKGPYDMSGIFFDENSKIELVEELVIFSDIKKDSRIPVANVSIDYVLKNKDYTKKSFNVFFVVPRGSSEFNISINDIDITESCIFREIPLPHNWIPSSTDALINPENGDVLASYYSKDEGNYRSTIWGLEIPISIDHNEYSNLHVGYKSEGGYYIGSKVKNNVYGFIYYLTPAKFWDGAPKVTLRINLPQISKYSFYSNIPLKKLKNEYYEVQLSDIPDNEWLFSFNSKAGLIYGTNNPSVHSKINIIVSILILISFVVLSMILKKEILKIFGYIFSVIIIFGFTGKITDGYIGDALIYMLLFLLLIIIIPMVYLIIRLQMKRKLKHEKLL